IGTHVRREVEIGEPVAVHVAHGDAAAVVVVEEVDDVERGILLRHLVDERDARGAWGQNLEQRGGLRRPGAGGEEQQSPTRSHVPYRSGRIRIACPPPGARTRWRLVLASTARCEIETGRGFVSQCAPGPSA